MLSSVRGTHPEHLVGPEQVRAFALGELNQVAIEPVDRSPGGQPIYDFNTNGFAGR